MIVVDTNLIAYVYLESQHAALAEQVLRQAPDWAAPLLWRSEFRSGLGLYRRRHWLSLAAAQAIMAAALGQMADHEYEVDSRRVLALVAESPCSAYDCEFVALAQELGVALVTLDKQILKAFPGLAVSPADFLDTPMSHA
jgi:predicted nucleic acid-binding protein